jgi:hypothetical protein
MIIAMMKLGIKIDAILFADTGGEVPETYDFIEGFDSYLRQEIEIGITTVKAKIREASFTRKPYIEAKQNWEAILKTGDKRAIALSIFWLNLTSCSWASLEEHALITNSLPSKAYGRSSCSYQFKIEPQDEWVKENFPNQRINKFIEIHHKEQSRIINKKSGQAMWKDAIAEYHYPLVAMQLDDHACQQIIASVGLPLPPKSSCFFCPNRKIQEVRELKDKHPELYLRGLLIEQTAMQGCHWREDTSTKGLGRKFAWKDLETYSEFDVLQIDYSFRSCGCID